MADEPNKKMDQLLRAYANERRKSGDLPLHPATRKVLLGEVARTYRARGESSPWTRIRAFWPQIAFGSGLCAILVIAVVSLRQPPKGNERVGPPIVSRPLAETLTLRDRDVGEKQENESLPRSDGLAPQSPPDSRLAPLQQAETAVGSEIARDEVASAAPPLRFRSEAKEDRFLKLQQAAPSGVNERESEVQKRSSSSRPSLSAASQASKRVANPSGDATAGGAGNDTALNLTRLSKANELTNLGAAMRLQFVELRGRREVNPQVLTSFQVEQAGDDFRVFDKDGSIYSGQLFPETETEDLAANRVVLAPLAEPSLALTELSQNTAVYHFFAQGTNRTLGKSVALEGRYLERTNGVPSPERTFSFSTNTPRATSSKAAPSSLRARRAIVGRATIAQTNQFPVTAVSVEP